MCGIAGAIAPEPTPDVSETVDRLIAELAHRGPDGRGIRVVVPGRAVLGHRRLSIVDLVGGTQPMSNEDGRVWVTYNGEIYNHLDLRRLLEARGHRFRTRSDTEVLVHGWEEWGRGLFGRLNGIYAFALFDERAGAAGELWLVRDPVGAKPLFVGRSRGLWWFASELQAARRARINDDELRAGAFTEYLVYRFVPSPGTFFRRTWKLPPGTMLRLPLADLPLEPVFEPFETSFAPTALPVNPRQWQAALREELGAAVQRQMMSDVPVGVLLSGGIDSTVIAALMRRGTPAPRAFGVGFADVLELDELSNARRAAAVLDLPFSGLGVTETDYLAVWPEVIATLGEPIANSGLLFVRLLCRAVAQTHKVVLSGQGADEPLGGYPRHTAERWHRIGRLSRSLLRLLPEDSLGSDRVARIRRVLGVDGEARRFTEILSVFSPVEALKMTRTEQTVEELTEPVRQGLGRAPPGDALNRLLAVDARLSLADDLLITADLMSMASSVELRVPFLDLQFLALVERMPSRYKVSYLGERKWLYRRAVRPVLPPQLRPALAGWRARAGQKLGFSTPLDRWFGHWIQTEAEAFFLGSGARLPDFVRGDAVRALVGQARDLRRPRGRQLAALYVLESWLRATPANTNEQSGVLGQRLLSQPPRR